MTGITGIAGIDMGRRFSGGDNGVVAINTVTDHLTVINPVTQHRRPACRQLVMTGITLIGTVDVRRRFATGIAAVMATDTVTDKCRVVHHCRQPGRNDMTDITFVRCR